MNKLATLILASALSVTFVSPVWARGCPKVIKEGRDLLAKAKLSKADADKIKVLIEESEKLHDGGDHGESMKKAKEALSLLGKK